MTPQSATDNPDFEEDKARLIRFVEMLRDMLEAALFERPELFGSHVGAFVVVWPLERDRFKEVIDALGGRADGEPLDEDQVNDFDAALAEHGLTGEELTLKLDIFTGAVLGFLDEVDRRDAAETYWKTWAARLEGPEPTSGIFRGAAIGRVHAALAATRRILKGGLRQVLGAGDMVFDSLGDVLSFVPGPKAAAAGIKEFKDAADAVLTEPDEADRPPRTRVQGTRPPGAESYGPKFEQLRWSATTMRSSRGT